LLPAPKCTDYVYLNPLTQWDNHYARHKNVIERSVHLNETTVLGENLSTYFADVRDQNNELQSTSDIWRMPLYGHICVGISNKSGDIEYPVSNGSNNRPDIEL
jgi:hypothetical protein